MDNKKIHLRGNNVENRANSEDLTSLGGRVRKQERERKRGGIGGWRVGGELEGDFFYFVTIIKL